MTVQKAKQIIKKRLNELNLPYTKLTARTIYFTDLTRSSCIFVKIHGWQPNPAWNELKALAIEHGFRLESTW